MRSLDLDRWRILDFEPGEGLGQGAAVDGGDGWMPVSAPGDVYLALIEAGRLVHPWRGRAEAEAAWVRDREWWWRTPITAPTTPDGETAELVFEGLDTFAVIYLDGEEIGRTGNMFRRHVFDIGSRLLAGRDHTLAIRFDPPSRVVPPGDLPVWTSFTDRVSRSRRNLMRKAQFGWGWDWGPDLPTAGIWAPARLEIRPRERITGLTVRTLSLTGGRAQIEIGAETRTHDAAEAALEITLVDPDGRTAFEHRVAPAHGGTIIPAVLEAPRLWWTADLGEQPLYSLQARLTVDGRRVDETCLQVGLRTLELDQSPDPEEPGTTFFRFVLNGVPIFARGACWVPASSFVGDIAHARYARLIDQSVGANMNMIRVWGGGLYEPDVFYDLCDRKGVLVWQDFMFACAHYPEDEAFVATVSGEVEDQVRRLRHHPCLALWCGNNENQAIHRIDGDRMGVETPLSGQALYDAVIPAIVERLDPATPYWPGSPWGGPHPNSMRAGDVHDWTVWHGVPPVPDDEMDGPFRSDPEGLSYNRYTQDTGRFISEFGLQAAPALATLKRWMDPRDLTLDSEGFLARIKDEARKAEAMMAPITGLPATIREYVDFTQWSQAEGLKFGIEHFRRRRPHCSGALIWQLNDCWPCVSWSLIDYEGVEKASWFAVRRAFAPVLASLRDTGDGQVELWITNDTREAIGGEAMLSCLTVDGEGLWRRSIVYAVGADSHQMIWTGPAPTAPDQVLWVSSPNDAFASNRRLSAPIADVPLVDAEADVRIEADGDGGLRVTLTAPAYLAFAHLVSERADLTFSDNFFDLPAGASRTVTVRGERPVAHSDIVVRCWNRREESSG